MVLKIITERAPMGVLTATDWFGVVILAKLFTEYMADAESFNSAKLAQMNKLFHNFGMTPPGRMSLAIPDPNAPEDPFDRFFPEHS